MRSDIDILSGTLKLPCGAVLKNRICKAAMTEGLAALADMAKAGKADGAHMWMQINHPGRQTQKMINSTQKHPLIFA